MRSKNVELMQNIIQYIDDTYSKIGRTPSYREIASKFNVDCSIISRYVKEMADRGMIKITPGSRGIRTASMDKNDKDNIQIGVIGAIACGTPIYTEENVETYISFPRQFLGSGKFYILRAVGNSMVNAGIEDGDLVIVRQQETAEQGQIVVALINDEATLKRFYRDDKKQMIRLHPENDEMEDMYFESIAIQGIAVKVLKDLE